MTLKSRLQRLESKTPSFYDSVDEIPTPVLEAMIRTAYRKGSHTHEAEELYRLLEQSGFEF
ncbi:hypothetical protein [Hyphomonas sp. GM-8P]|uniref:hypothetical protein n=1 Tax=Hyphomonas sp. GM-8P TaxID=1280945 RepID=UPI000DC04E41|nr:hypothetical protein [Hyphomonas sp. GM-8P]RAN40499.1 hypothetical protein HY26_12145 [Hyphomonas sp. GM-8P]